MQREEVSGCGEWLFDVTGRDQRSFVFTDSSLLTAGLTTYGAITERETFDVMCSHELLSGHREACRKGCHMLSSRSADNNISRPSTGAARPRWS